MGVVQGSNHYLLVGFHVLAQPVEVEFVEFAGGEFFVQAVRVSQLGEKLTFCPVH